MSLKFGTWTSLPLFGCPLPWPYFSTSVLVLPVSCRPASYAIWCPVSEWFICSCFYILLQSPNQGELPTELPYPTHPLSTITHFCQYVPLPKSKRICNRMWPLFWTVILTSILHCETCFVLLYIVIPGKITESLWSKLNLNEEEIN